MNKSILFILFFFASAFAYAAKPVGNEEEKKGLYWYERPVQEQGQEEKYERPIMPSRAAIMKMHPDQIKVLLDKALKYAVYTEKEEDVLAYNQVYDAMRRKSASFAAVNGYVQTKYPEYSSKGAYATTNASRNQSKKSAGVEIDEYITNGQSEYALIMFSKKTCGYCQIQKATIENFNRKHHWNFKDVDIDEHPIAQEKYGITGTPITILVNKHDKDKFLPVAIGVASLSELKINAYRAIRILDEKIKPSQFYTRDRDIGGFFDPEALSEGE